MRRPDSLRMKNGADMDYFVYFQVVFSSIAYKNSGSVIRLMYLEQFWSNSKVALSSLIGSRGTNDFERKL